MSLLQNNYPKSKFAQFQKLARYKAFTSDTLKNVFNEYKFLCQKNSRIVGKPEWREGYGEINVIGVRNNPEISFNDSVNTFYNDLLIIIQYLGNSENIYLYCTTMDPRGKSNNIAHLLEGIYGSYTALRPHKFVPGRTALVQDRDSVLIARTNKEGKVKSIKPEYGFFGINIHDSGGYKNSSMGCTVLEPDSKDNNFQFTKSFKPLITNITNKSSVDYCVINFETFRELVITDFNRKNIDIDYLSTLTRPLELLKKNYGI